MAIVLAAPPNSAIRYALDAGWSRSDHLLANLGEQQAGKLDVNGRYARPGVPQAQTEQKRDSLFPVDSMSWDDMDAMLAANYAQGEAATN